MSLDVASIAQNPLRRVVFFGLLLVVRGVPALLVYREELDLRERFEATLAHSDGVAALDDVGPDRARLGGDAA